MNPVLLIGGTGTIGSAVARELIEDGRPVRVLSRESRAGDSPSVEMFTGDLTDPASLEPALDGVGAVFLVWTAPPATAADVIARIASHTKRVVYLSAPHNVAHPFFQATPDNAMAQLHRHVERELANADVNATILRPGMFMSNALHWWAPTVARGETVRWPYGAAETAPVDERDVAAVAARVLCDVGHDRDEYILTGSESLSQAAQVQLIGEVLGRRIQFVDVPEEEFRREVGGVWPPAALDMLLAAWRGTMREPAYITSDVYEVTGAQPRTFREWVEDNVDAFR